MDALVEQIVRRIVEAIQPQRVILFGSRARGEAGPHSDVDLLLIYDGELSKREVELRVHGLFPIRHFAMDVFVLTPAEFEQQREVVSTVGRIAALEGVLCHER